MANKNQGNQNTPGKNHDREANIQKEVTPPMPKPERKEEDNDFTKGNEDDKSEKNKNQKEKKPEGNEYRRNINDPVAQEEKEDQRIDEDTDEEERLDRDSEE